MPIAPIDELVTGVARDLYHAALPGIDMLTPRTRRGAQASAVGYAAILEAIEEARYGTKSTRAGTCFLRKTRLMLSRYAVNDPAALLAGSATQPAVA